jgi:hypothetical protein
MRSKAPACQHTLVPRNAQLTLLFVLLLHPRRSKLLPAMVPSQLVVLDVMPRLPNGKIDVKSLTEPPPAWGHAAAGADSNNAAADGIDGSSGGADPTAAAAMSPLEMLMREAWSEVLHLPVEKLGVGANFFALGGNSLRAGLINSKVRRITEFDIPGLLIYKVRKKISTLLSQ